MRRASSVLVVVVLVFILLSSGCTGGGGGEASSTEAHQATDHTTQEVSSGGSPSESVVTGPEDAYGLTHVKYSSNGAKWVSIWVDGTRWNSGVPEFHLQTSESSWFYSSGHLYAFEYGGETLYEYAKEGDETPYPWFILKVPYEGVAFHRAGPEGAVLVLARDGKLHLLVYDPDEAQKWPSEEDLKLIYYSKIKHDFSWKVGGNHLAAGWDYDGNYIHYVAWGGRKVWIISFTNSELADLIEENGKKPEPKVFTFDSEVRSAIVGEHGIYVWAGDKLHTFDMERGEKVSSINVPSDGTYYLDIEPSEDVLCFYDGKKAVILHLSGGELNGRETVNLPDYDLVGYNDNSWTIVGFKGKKVDFYDYDPDFSDIEYVGSLKLPAPVKTGEAYISTEGDAYAYFWGTDGRYYMVNGELSEEAPAETSSEVQTSGEEETETPTQTETSPPSEEGTQKPFRAVGIDTSRHGYKYFGLKIIPLEGHLEYFPYGDDSYLYQITGKYVFRIYPWDSDYWDGYSSKPNIEVPTPQLLPEEPKAFYGVPNGDNYILVGESGKLHLLVGYGDEVEVNGRTLETFKAHVKYSFNADGVVIDPNHHDYIAWKGEVLRIYAYTDDEHYAMWDDGEAIRVDPFEYEFPEDIVEVNPYLDDNFIVVRTEGGLYLLPKPNGAYGDDPYIYRVIDDYVDFVGAIHYWGIGALVVYLDGTLYYLEIDYDPDQYEMELSVGAQIDVPDVVGLYGPDSQDPYVVLSTEDGTLLVYSYVWDDEIGDYVFKREKSYDLGVSLVKLYADYRPEWDWIKVLGLSEDGTFYNLKITGPNAG